jgi:uncharacterized protein YdaU (DUF1376 family)
MADNFIPYFKFYPADFMNGVRGLTPQEVGVYIMLLCRIYEENGPIEKHELRLATYCAMRPPTFRKVLKQLLELGKLNDLDGFLSSDRADDEMLKRAEVLKKNSKAGKVSAEKRQQKQTYFSANGEQRSNDTDTDTDTEDGADASARALDESPRPIENPTLREEILLKIGIDRSGLTGRGGSMLGGQADMAEVSRWLKLPRITKENALMEIERVMAGKRDGPPNSFRYFSAAMEKLSGELIRPHLEPSAAMGHPRPLPQLNQIRAELPKGPIQ